MNSITSRDIMRMALNVFLEQSFVLVMVLVNSVMVSHAGLAALSGVGYVDQINVLVNGLIVVVANGVTILVSQYVGRSDAVAAQNASRQAYGSSHFISAAATLLILLFGKTILWSLLSGAGEDIFREAGLYMTLVAFSYPFYAFYVVSCNILRAYGNTRSPMFVSVGMTLVNVLLAALFIYGFGMGVIGAAVAALLARAFGAAFGGALVKKSGVFLHIREFFTFRLQFNVQKALLLLGVPVALETALFQLGKIINSYFVVQTGGDQLTIHAASIAMADVQCIGGVVFAIIATPLVGFAKGSGDSEAAKKRLRFCALICFGSVFLTSIPTIPFLPRLVGLLNVTGDIADGAVRILTWNAVCAFLLYSGSFVLPFGFKGAGDVMYPTGISVLVVYCIRVPLCYLFSVVLGWGALGLWAAMWVDWAVRSAFYLVRYLRGRWLLVNTV